MALSKQFNKAIGTIVNLVTSSVSQTSVKKDDTSWPAIEGISGLCRQAAAEGMVLLKNNNSLLPIQAEDNLAVFGRVQYDTFYFGYGSGGDVNAPYKISFMDAIEKSSIKYDKELAKLYKDYIKSNPVYDGYWGHWPMCYDEMPLEEKVVKTAASKCNKAILFIGRAAGEDRENTLTEGSFYLTSEEENELKLISENFSDFAVILNAGNIIDYSFVEKYNVPCVLIAGLGGMEAGNALVDILTGAVSPSGCLTDTIARTYKDYPSSDNFGDKDENVYKEDIFVGYRYYSAFGDDSVLFPFGKGLSYTDFGIECIEFNNNDKIEISLEITNTGKYDGKKTVLIYAKQPEGKLPKAGVVLCAFAKTPLLTPGASCRLNISFPYYAFASFDDSGCTGHENAYVLEAGDYSFCIGNAYNELTEIGSLSINETTVIQQLNEVAAPEKRFMRIKPLKGKERTVITYEPVPTKTVDLKKHIEDALPANGKFINREIPFRDVIENKATVEEFAASLSYDDLEAISRGHYIMNSPLGTTGNAGVFGGVTENMQSLGVPAICCTDGPSGIRLAKTCTLLPSGSTLAASYNTELIAQLYSLIGKEMKELGSRMLLAPGMNIHRNPLCGRNFEYFSEDPIVAGKIAAAVVNGLQSSGVSSCPKHFACNNQEVNRTKNNSVVSQRALREIYLKGFEICVREASPMCIMTSYNKVNGVWSHYNYELCKDILRDEWGYKGMVMTDWWMQPSVSPEFPLLEKQAYRVRSHVNVLMPGGERAGAKKPDGTLLSSLDKEGGIRSAELQKNAEDVLNFIIRLNSNN